MSTHPQQLSTQQLEHAIKNLEKRVKAKTLECASLSDLRAAAPACLDDLMRGDSQPIATAVSNYLTAKLNFALVDLEELELTLKAYKSMSSNIVLATGVKIG